MYKKRKVVTEVNTHAREEGGTDRDRMGRKEKKKISFYSTIKYYLTLANRKVTVFQSFLKAAKT